MLALTRKKGEALVINNNIEITVLEIRGQENDAAISADGLDALNNLLD